MDKIDWMERARDEISLIHLDIMPGADRAASLEKAIGVCDATNATVRFDFNGNTITVEKKRREQF